MTLCCARSMPALLGSPIRQPSSLDSPNAFNEEVERYHRQQRVSPSSSGQTPPALDRSSVAPLNRLLQTEVLCRRIAPQALLLWEFCRSQRMLQLSVTVSKMSAFDPDFKLLRSTLLHFWMLTSLFSGHSGRLQEWREDPRDVGENRLASWRRPRSRLCPRKEPVRLSIPV